MRDGMRLRLIAEQIASREHPIFRVAVTTTVDCSLHLCVVSLPQHEFLPVGWLKRALYAMLRYQGLCLLMVPKCKLAVVS